MKARHMPGGQVGHKKRQPRKLPGGAVGHKRHHHHHTGGFGGLGNTKFPGGKTGTPKPRKMPGGRIRHIKKHKARRKRGLSPGLDYDGCAVAAAAAALEEASGLRATAGELRELFLLAGGTDHGGAEMGAVLEVLAVRGLAGARLIQGYELNLELPDAEFKVPGLILGVALPGSHFVVTGLAESYRPPPASTCPVYPVGAAGQALTGELSPAVWLTWGGAWYPEEFGGDVTIEEAWQVHWTW